MPDPMADFGVCLWLYQRETKVAEVGTHPGSQSRLTQGRNGSQALPPRARFFPVPHTTPPIPLAPRGG